MIRAGLCAALALAIASAAARADLRAERITRETASALSVGGPDAIGGEGDWWLANDVVEAVIDDVSREYGISTHGGTIVDLGLRGRASDDQFARLSPLVNLSQRVVVGYDAIRAEVDPQGRFARIVVTSPGLRALSRGSRWARALDPFVPAPEAISAVRAETVYEVRPGEPFVRIDTLLTNTGDAPAPVFAFGDLWMRGGRGGRGFLGDIAAPARARGFRARDMTANMQRSAGALTSYSHAALVGSPDFPPIAYALYAPERAQRGLPLYGMAGEHATFAFGLVGDPPVSELGLLAIARAWFRDLAPGASWRFERRLRAEPLREIAALDAAIRRESGAGASGGIEGVVAIAPERRAVVLVEGQGGVPVTQLAVDPGSGGFRADLPPGDYVAELRVAHGPSQRRAVRVGRERSAVTFDAPPPLATLVFERAFADGGAGRVEIRGRDGTPDPVFGDDLLGAASDDGPLRSGSASSAVVFVGNESDPREVELAPGRYRLVATRGLDWQAAVQDVELAAPGARAAVAPFALAPLEPLAGFVAADLHVHAEASDDSQATNEDRLRRFVAEGVGVIVATDHDHVANYAPALSGLGLEHRIRVVHGVEVTGSSPSAAALWTIGHHNAWPIPWVDGAHRHGAPPSQNRAVGAIYGELRGRYGARVIQLNHPRPTPRDIDNGDLHFAFFAHQGEGWAYDPLLPLGDPIHEPLVRRTGAGGTRALDFDALEVMNGDSYAQYLATRADWFALMRQGERRTATANSDSHAPGELPAYPRNYVYVGEAGDQPQAARSEPQASEDQQARFDAALREGRSFGTTGPRVRVFRVNGAALGDRVAAPGGEVKIEFAVDGADWVPIDEVRIAVNGEVVHVSREREGSLALTFVRDSFVTLEAGAPLDVEPGAWRQSHPGLYSEVIAPGFVSTAFTNPIFVDVDGNGRFDPPGLGNGVGVD